MKKKLALPVLLLLLVSCSENGTFEIQPESPIAKVQEPEGMMVLGEKLNNPYSIANMQAACNVLSATRADGPATLEPNKLYVRFLPKDSADISVLDNLDLELFDYPLDYDIVMEGDYYHDPSIPEDMPTWQYTTVDIDFPFPAMQYEIIDECYIPEYSDNDAMETKSATNNYMYVLETTAISSAGLPEKYQVCPETRALGVGKKPSGTIMIENDYTKAFEPLKGVKVRCHYLVNISNAYTDSQGKYQIKNKYVCKPHYAIIYDSEKDFTIWGNWSFVAAAQHALGYQSNSGYNKKVKKEEKEWKWAVIANAGYDYYTMCKQDGIKTPPSNLKIWCRPDAAKGGAPMLKHVTGIDIVSYAKWLASVPLSGNVTAFMSDYNTIHKFVSIALPDVVIGMTRTYNLKPNEIKTTPNDHYEYHYGLIWHELSHASHYANVGEKIWAPYINTMVKNTAKDDYAYAVVYEDTKGMNICGVGESWAFANQRYIMNDKFNIVSNDGYLAWFSSYIVAIYNLSCLKNNIKVSRKQIFDCMTRDVSSLKELKSALLKAYPDKATDINYSMVGI